jgi:hypothetical protein
MIQKTKSGNILQALIVKMMQQDENDGSYEKPTYEDKDAIEKIFKHHKCFDIFQNIRINGQKLFGEQSRKRFVKYKNMRIETEEQLEKINHILSLKAVHDEAYLRLVLMRIHLARQIFIMNIEIGLEILIPKHLGMDSLPLSFKFYDPI